MHSFAAGSSVRHRVFVSYHHGGDRGYYQAFSNAFHDRHDVIYDNSVEREIDSEDQEYVIRRIRENFITGSSCTIVLVGRDTWGRKYVDWEIKATLDKGHGLIGVFLPTAARVPNDNTKILVPARLHDNIESGLELWTSWEALTASTSSLDRAVIAAKAANTGLIVNSRERRTVNA